MVGGYGRNAAASYCLFSAQFTLLFQLFVYYFKISNYFSNFAL